MRSILMIYPEMPETYWGFKYSLRFIGKKSNYPPLGLLTVAALLPDHYKVKLVDMNVTKLRDKYIEEADLIFISAMIVQKESMEKVIEKCKKYGKPVVAGGPYPTNSYHLIEGVDHFVLNEAEVTLPLFIKDLEAGKPQKIYMTDIKPDVTKTPVPRFDLINKSNYSSIILQYSRGCPFNCEFCDIIELFGRVPRTKHPAQFLAEVEKIYDSGYRGSIFIVDDNFIGNKQNVKSLLKNIIIWQKKHRYPFFFITETSINLSSDEELMDLMVEAGFNMVFIGIETPVKESLVMTKKSQNTNVGLFESVRKIQNRGMEVSAGFILGFDNDPDNIFELQSEFIRKSGIPMAMVGLLTALPKTQLFRRLNAENRILEDSSGNNTFDMQVNFIPKMPPDKLKEGYKKVISDIYNPEQYFKRCSDLIENLPDNYRFGPDSPSISELLRSFSAFLISLFKQSLSGYGKQYLRFIYSVLVNKPGLFPKAIQLSILGYHLIKMTDLQIARKTEEIKRFGIYLERILAGMNKRIALTRNLNFKEIFQDLTTFRKKVLPDVYKRYLKIYKFSNNTVEMRLKNIAENSRLYYEKARASIKIKIEAIDFSGLQDTLKMLIKFKRELLSGFQLKCGVFQKNIGNYSKELFENIDGLLNMMILETESLIYKKAEGCLSNPS